MSKAFSLVFEFKDFLFVLRWMYACKCIYVIEMENCVPYVFCLSVMSPSEKRTIETSLLH